MPGNEPSLRIGAARAVYRQTGRRDLVADLYVDLTDLHVVVQIAAKHVSVAHGNALHQHAQKCARLPLKDKHTRGGRPFFVEVVGVFNGDVVARDGDRLGDGYGLDSPVISIHAPTPT